MQSANTIPKLPPIEAFHVGTHTDMRGQKFTFTRDDMVKMCSAYDPVLFAAPMVIGHPDHTAPAVGWLGKLAVNDDGVVVATDHDAVNPEFAALVGAKSFRKVSLSMFKPDAADNPKPGVWYPRHLGWLGAAQPALTGLKAVNFSADQTGYVSFMDYDDMTLVGLLRGIKNFFLAKFSTDAVGVENALPEYQLQQLLISAAAEDATETTSSMSYAAQQALAATQLKDDTMSAEQLKAAQDSAAAEKARADAAVAKLAAAEAAAQSVYFAAEAKTLIAEGRLHPDEELEYVAFMGQTGAGDTVSFTAADGAAKSFSASEFMTRFIKRRAPLVEMTEIAKGKAAGTTTVAFSAPSDLAVSAERNDLHARASALAAENKLSYIDAVRQLEAA